jgi:uncharacterized membrane protein YukC
MVQVLFDRLVLPGSQENYQDYWKQTGHGMFHTACHIPNMP